MIGKEIKDAACYKGRSHDSADTTEQGKKQVDSGGINRFVSDEVK